MTAAEVLQLAQAKSVLLATAESCTGGMIAAALTDPPGASAVFDRGFVTYSNAAKIDLLGVSGDLIASHGAVSEPVARAMAAGAVEQSDACLAVSVTGVAGPGGTAHKPEGMVCFAVARRFGEPHAQTQHFGALGRDQVRRATVQHALALLAEALHEI